MKKIRAFTLIELMVAISIMGILMMASYAPYQFYQNKAKLKVTTREISQILYEARNMAINGSIESSSNVSIGVYFDNSNASKNVVRIFSYPYNLGETDIKNQENLDIKLIKKFILKPGIEINEVEGKNKFLFYFKAITGDLKYYEFDNIGNKTIINEDIIDIEFSYKGATSGTLNRKIEYFTKTNITDY